MENNSYSYPINDFRVISIDSQAAFVYSTVGGYNGYGKLLKFMLNECVRSDENQMFSFKYVASTTYYLKADDPVFAYSGSVVYINV